MKNDYAPPIILQYIKDVVIIFCLIELIRTRYSSDKSAPWIGYVTYIGLLIAMYDLFLECILKYHHKRGFGAFIIICLFPIINSMVIMMDIFTGARVLDSKTLDIYTLITLAISLPRKLYISLIGLILRKDRGL